MEGHPCALLLWKTAFAGERHKLEARYSWPYRKTRWHRGKVSWTSIREAEEALGPRLRLEVDRAEPASSASDDDNAQTALAVSRYRAEKTLLFFFPFFFFFQWWFYSSLSRDDDEN